MARLEPLVITARLQQGLTWDPRYGIALDGLLTSLIRASEAQKRALGSGSLLDGGLDLVEPTEWELPLAKCAGDAESGWHWMATAGQPIDHLGNPMPKEAFDPHRLMVKLDERRSEEIAVALPKNLGGPRGRYRTRITPVLVTVCAGIVWHAIGERVAISRLLSELPTIGARRGSGEGAVVEWRVQKIKSIKDEFVFAHTNPDDSLGRPVPEACAVKLGFDTSHRGFAGLRPPMFHKARQKWLVLPKF